MATYILLVLLISALAVDGFFELRRDGDAKQSAQRHLPRPLKDEVGGKVEQ